MKALACNTTTATRGSATAEMLLPKRLVVRPSHSNRKFRCRSNPSMGRACQAGHRKRPRFARSGLSTVDRWARSPKWLANPVVPRLPELRDEPEPDTPTGSPRPVRARMP
ncbi:hypothetical protein GCM10017788_04370 [Amycolatopsis acidiphila]|nr:hypothetical protein GCM10017788_04370 [Amycolatopsis acidiphila]